MAPAVLNFDLWVMLAVAFACLPVFMLRSEIGRRRGLMFLAFYVAYVAYLILGAQDHDALDEFSAVMLSFVLPITVVTLVAMVIRDQGRADRPARPE
jgi:cation:H+ antiporter